ncbi:MAG: hypothetical protein ACRD29_19620, partial [Acidimicrobiales bacterium]
MIAACLMLMAAPAAAVAASTVGDRPVVEPGQPSEEAPDDEEFTCNGPPPFASQAPEGETEEERAANREAEAETFEAWREANCPEEDDDGQAPSEQTPPGAQACVGPPPFAEVPAEPADPSAGVIPSPRAEEATGFAETRSTCRDSDAGASPGPVPAPTAPGGTPSGTEGGPPEDVPPGPPGGVPGGP